MRSCGIRQCRVLACLNATVVSVLLGHCVVDRSINCIDYVPRRCGKSHILCMQNLHVPQKVQLYIGLLKRAPQPLDCNADPSDDNRCVIDSIAWQVGQIGHNDFMRLQPKLSPVQSRAAPQLEAVC